MALIKPMMPTDVRSSSEVLPGSFSWMRVAIHRTWGRCSRICCSRVLSGLEGCSAYEIAPRLDIRLSRGTLRARLAAPQHHIDNLIDVRRPNDLGDHRAVGNKGNALAGPRRP